MIKVQSISKAFDGRDVLKDVHMTVDKGTIYGLVGSNGSGKTTLFKILTGIYRPDDGVCWIDGEVFGGKVALRDMYYVQEELFLQRNQTLLERFNEERLYYPYASEQVFMKLVQFFGLKINQKLTHYSKGQNKQAAFVLAIASQASILLLDEIVDGIDAVVRKKFWKVLLSEVMTREITVLMASHALSELDNVCDKVGILHGAHIIKEEKMDQLKEDVKRVQYALKGGFLPTQSDEYTLLRHWQVGQVAYAVLKGDIGVFKRDLEAFGELLLFEVLDMNLEEIFISELGGVGYGNESY